MRGRLQSIYQGRAVHEDGERGLLIAEVQLFADSQTPSYEVILGKLKASKDSPLYEDMEDILERKKSGQLKFHTHEEIWNG